jgi:outer membrane protein TolC
MCRATLAIGMAVCIGMTTVGAQTPSTQTPASGQTTVSAPPVSERITFKEAIDRALARNPSIAQAAADILRANALLRQARANTLPGVTGGATNTTLNKGVTFEGAEVSPRNQFVADINASSPLYAPVLWAQKAQAGDQVAVAERGRDEARRQIALASGHAYIQIIAQRRVAEAQLRARDTARAHFDLAHVQQERGAGSRLNELRAQQEVSTDESALEDALFAVYQAQEALGVLLGSDSPVDAVEDPVLEVPGTPDTPQERVGERADIRLAAAREAAAQRIVNDSWKDWLPFASGAFVPQYQNPGSIFSPTWSWRAVLTLDVPIFDSGFRAARKAEREALLSNEQLESVALRRQAASEIRAFTEAVRSAERSLAAARDGADQAQRVVEIVNVAFKAGASTNIEVIDAQRTARDADTAAAAAEDKLRRAKLDLLVATGRFPY